MTSLARSGGTTIYVTDGTYSFDGETWMGIDSWPIVVTNIDTEAGYLIVKPVSGTTLSSTNCYFVCNSDYIQFGSTSATRTTLYVTADNYGGLIQNGTSSDGGFNNIRVYNIDIASSNYGSAWIGRNYYGRNTTNCRIVCCSSSGNISPYGGGIVGQSSSQVSIIGCWSSGEISSSGGGIVGEGSLGVSCDSCYSSGAIGSSGGGIVGERCYTGTITNCYSTGYIGSQCGGICGANSDHVYISAAYSTGTISTNAGGIVGRYADTATIINCYTTGNIATSSSGGIVGTNSSSLTISHCYTVGQTFNGTGQIIGGSNSVPANCYYGDWSSVFASLYLQLNAWISPGTNLPFLLKNMGYSPYNEINIDEDGDPVRTSSQTIVLGQYTAAATSGSDFAILSDTGANSIHSVSGSITGTEPGTYTLYIQGNGVTIFTLTILAVPLPAPRVRARFSNNLVFYKAGSLSASGSMGVRNYRVVARKT